MSTQPPTTERLERFRDYLTLLARTQIGVKYQRKIDASAVVNIAILRAYQQREQFRGSNDAELAAWLRRVLASRLAEAFRVHHREKRDLDREQSLDSAVDQSCTRLEDWLVAIQTSPSAKAVRSEQLMRLAWALGELPDDQRVVVELRHLHGCVFLQIAEHLGRSRGAVAGLLRRGLKRLRELLDEPASQM